jgi:YD repeat-containing protein
MTSRSIDSRIVARVLAGIVLLLLVLVAVDRFLPSSGAKKFGYDRQGRLISRTTLNGRMIKYAYDKAGLLTEVSYHQLGAITKFAYPGSDSVKYEYDLTGNRVAMKDKIGRTQYVYDNYNRLSQLTTFDGKKISYEYDAWNQVRRILLPDGSRIEYQHDLTGNIIGVNDGQQGGLHYEYHPDTNQVHGRLPNGILTVYECSPLGELNSIRHLQADGTLICSYRYTHDSDGRINQIEEATSQGVVTTNNEYDLAGRVSKVSQSDGSTVTYEYDLMGNRMAQTDTNGTIRYEYDARGRLLKAGEVGFAYDDAGNVVSRKSKAENEAYKYDDENRLLEVRSSKSTIRYTYDGEGSRVRREVNGRVTNYLNELVMGMPK